MAKPTNETHLAVLIDADNASAKHLELLLVEIAKYGTATVRRAYGDWTSTQLAKWKDLLVTNSLQPIQQFANTVDKNSTDSALIIDAMDLLHGGMVDGFCEGVHQVHLRREPGRRRYPTQACGNSRR